MVNLLYLLKIYLIVFINLQAITTRRYCNRRQRLVPQRCTQMPRNIFKKDAKKRFVICEINILYVPLLDRQLGKKNAARLLTVQLSIYFMVFPLLKRVARWLSQKGLKRNTSCRALRTKYQTTLKKFKFCIELGCINPETIEL